MTETFDSEVERVRARSTRKLVSAFCFLVLAPLIVLSLARFIHYEGSKFVVLFTAFALYIYLPAYLMLLFAIFTKRKVLTVVCALLVVSHITWVLPNFSRADDLPAAAAAAPKLTVLSQNIKYDNATPERVIETIRDANADVVMLQELTWDTSALLKRSGVFADYPYSFDELDGGGASGIGMWSKIKFDSKRKAELGHAALRVELTVDNRQVTLWNIHTYSPLRQNGNEVDLWKLGLQQTATALHGESGNVIAAGDFNATRMHHSYRKIVDNGYHDEHVRLGQGNARTWPVDYEWTAPFGGLIQIDHVLTHGNVRAVKITQTPGLGSDHRGNLTTFALL